MKSCGRALIIIFALIVISLTLSFPSGREHDPRDLSYWLRADAARDWSAAAARGEPLAQFHWGLTLIRTNLVIMIDRVPLLSAIPLIGKRYFETITYGIDGNISQEQMMDAYEWIKKSADQGFAPAKAAEKLFTGKIEKLNQSSAGNAGQPIRSETNQASATAGPDR